MEAGGKKRAYALQFAKVIAERQTGSGETFDIKPLTFMAYQMAYQTHPEVFLHETAVTWHQTVNCNLLRLPQQQFLSLVIFCAQLSQSRKA
jgi:hypothetical protein